jgi:ribosomal 50S subunit-recycling heat shock protein
VINQAKEAKESLPAVAERAQNHHVPIRHAVNAHHRAVIPKNLSNPPGAARNLFQSQHVVASRMVVPKTSQLISLQATSESVLQEQAFQPEVKNHLRVHAMTVTIQSVPPRFSDIGDSKDFSKPRRSYGRKDDSSGRPSRGDKPFGRSNDDSSERPSRGGNFKRRSEGGDTPREQKSFSRSRDDRDDSKRPSRFSDKDDTKPPSKFSEEGESKRSKFSDKEERGDKKGFFSKLSRGGKSFTRTAAPAPDYGKTIEKGKEDFGTTEKIRLNRYISNSGVCSRREADELIKMGLVTVNGTVVTEMGHKVDRKDVIKYDGKTLRAEKPVYILMNKPKGFLTTTKDPQDRNTVMQIIAESVKERVYPVGRLDRNTTGLLLLTNDGELTDKLSHPSYNVKKIYKVDLDKPLTKADFEKIKGRRSVWKKVKLWWMTWRWFQMMARRSA